MLEQVELNHFYTLLARKEFAIQYYPKQNFNFSLAVLVY